ncbi:unnamed protein product [Clonostachys rhizophaga]|uniref:Helicase ATP-binding domain-containing protein n=1 Tax=Clonostachys rhizophaga TaxID=160324 RepID=A0A9N9YVL6_9HYPO|nr:unnamed protein product [Clonostachys rhizophaga]
MSHVLDDPDMQKKIEEFRRVSSMKKDFNIIQSQVDTYLLPGFVIQPRKQTSILREQQRLLGCAGVVEAGADNPADAPPRSVIDCPIQTPLSYSDICKFPKQIRVGDQMVNFYDYVTSSEFDRLLLIGVTKAMRFAQSPFKGGFICDDTGTGKSLTALLTALKLQEQQRPRCGFILVVCPPGCETQWATEIKKHFKPENRPSYIILRHATYPVQKLLEYDVVICTAQFVQACYYDVLPYLHRQLRYHFALLLSATPMCDNWTDVPKQMGLLPGGGPFLNEQHMNLVLGTGTPGEANFQKKIFERFSPALTVGRPKKVHERRLKRAIARLDQTKDTACSINNAGNADLFYDADDEWEEETYD